MASELLPEENPFFCSVSTGSEGHSFILSELACIINFIDLELLMSNRVIMPY